jgi:hypothetical protein
VSRGGRRTHVKVLSFVGASPEDWRRGLLGFVRVRVGGLIVDGIAVRVTSAGKPVLIYPSRRSRTGARHAVSRPATEAARRAIQRAVFSHLGLEQEEQP